MTANNKLPTLDDDKEELAMFEPKEVFKPPPSSFGYATIDKPTPPQLKTQTVQFKREVWKQSFGFEVTVYPNGEIHCGKMWPLGKRKLAGKKKAVPPKKKVNLASKTEDEVL